MPDPLTTLFTLTDAIEGLDQVQTMIDIARNSAQTDQSIQLELDRQQAHVDRSRKLVERMMANIRNQN